MARLTSRLIATSSVQRSGVMEIVRYLNDLRISQSAGYCRQKRECAMGGSTGTLKAMRSTCVFRCRGKERNAACADEAKHAAATAVAAASRFADRTIVLSRYANLRHGYAK